MTTMYDAVDINNIPANATWVAGYVNGSFATFNPLVKKFPRARHVSIDVNGSGVADVLDVERYDATPADAPVWARRMRALKRPPIIYCSASNIQAVRNAFSADHEPEPFFWVADWTNQPHLYPGCIGTQWADGTPQFPGLALGTDTSEISPNWPPLGKVSLIKKIVKVLNTPIVIKKPKPPAKVKTLTPTQYQSCLAFVNQILAEAGF